jgi:hypothetical protein
MAGDRGERFPFGPNDRLSERRSAATTPAAPREVTALAAIDQDPPRRELNALYQLYRKAALNKEYYARRLVRIQNWNLVLEALIAATATGSSISTLGVMTIDLGKVSAWLSGVQPWNILLGSAAILALLRPFLQLSKKVERYSRLFTGHLDNYLQLESIVRAVERTHKYNSAQISRFESIERRYIELSRSDDPVPSDRLISRCERIVNERIGWDKMWYPSEDVSLSNESQPIGSTVIAISEKSRT